MLVAKAYDLFCTLRMIDHLSLWTRARADIATSIWSVRSLPWCCMICSSSEYVLCIVSKRSCMDHYGVVIKPHERRDTATGKGLKQGCLTISRGPSEHMTKPSEGFNKYMVDRALHQAAWITRQHRCQRVSTWFYRIISRVGIGSLPRKEDRMSLGQSLQTSDSTQLVLSRFDCCQFGWSKHSPCPSKYTWSWRRT